MGTAALCASVRLIRIQRAVGAIKTRQVSLFLMDSSMRGAARQGQDTLPGPLPQGGGLVVAPRGLPPRQAGPSSVGEIAAALPGGASPDRHPPGGGGGGGYEGTGPSYHTASRRGSPEEESFSRCSRRRDGVTHIGLPPEEGRGKYFPKRFCALFILVLDKKLSKLFIAPQARQELMRRLLRQTAAKGRRWQRRLLDKNQRFLSRKSITDIFPLTFSMGCGITEEIQMENAMNGTDHSGSSPCREPRVGGTRQGSLTGVTREQCRRREPFPTSSAGRPPISGYMSGRGGYLRQ